MSASDEPREPLPLTAAQECFARWLEGVEDRDAAEFDAWCAEHRELEPALRRLHASWLALQRAVGALDEPPRPQEWITLRGTEPAREPAAPEGERESRARSLLRSLRARATAAERYRIEGELGRGAEGVVYRAHDAELDRTLAIKVMQSASVGADELGARRAELARVVRFLSEASVTAKLDHPGVVPVHDVGVDAQGRLFFTMKLVVGRRLDEIFECAWRRSDGWDAERVIGVLQRVCEAVQFAHSRGVVHRDLKPSNILVGDFGEVYVMDWGLALELAVPRARGGSAVGQGNTRGSSPPVGTAPYLAPEQARGDLHVIDGRADVHALGALLYQFLARRPPYVAPGERLARGELVRRVVAGAPAGLRSLAPRAPRELVAIAGRAMEREPDDRYATVAALASDLTAFQQFRGGSAWRDGPVAFVVKAVRRHAAAAAMIVLLLLVGTLLSVLVSYSERSAELSRRERNEVVQRSLATLAELDRRFVSAFDSQDRAARAGLEVLQLRINELEHLGLLGSAGGPPPMAFARFAEIQRDDAGVRPKLVGALLGIRVGLELSGAGHGARLLAGRFPGHLSQRSRELATRLASEDPELCRAHTAIGELLGGVELSPGEHRFVELADAFFERGVRAPPADELEASWPGTPQEFVGLALLLALTERPEAAIPMLERLSQQHPDSAAVHQSLAINYLNLKPPLPDRAELHASAFAALIPDSSAAFDVWASVFVSRRQYRQALQLQLASVSRGDPGSRAWSNLANIQLELDQDTDALVSATRACELRGVAKEAYLNRGLAQWRLGRPEEALASFNEALALDPSYAKAWYWKARSLVMLDRFDEAMAAHAHAPELEREPYVWFLWHGQALLDIGEPECAQRAFESAGRLNPGSGNARAGLARALVYQGESGVAVVWLIGSLGNLEARAALACAMASAHSIPVAALQLGYVLGSVRVEIDRALAFASGASSDPPVATSRERIEFLERLLTDSLLAPLWNVTGPPELVIEVDGLRRNAQSLLEIARSLRP